jgi:hypothetical protein
VHSEYLGNVVAGVVGASVMGALAELHSKLTFSLNPTSGISVRVTVAGVPGVMFTVPADSVICTLGTIT